MLVIDIESSGVDSKVHGILSIGGVDYLNPERRFYGECRLWKDAHIMDDSLEVNGFSRESVWDLSKQSEESLIRDFIDWFSKSENHNLAGQNPHFDLSFLIECCLRNKVEIPFARRLIDLHSVAIFHMLQSGVEVPSDKGRSNVNSDLIMRYVGIPEEPHPHNALNGAIWEAEAFSRFFNGVYLFKQFESYPVPWKS